MVLRETGLFPETIHITFAAVRTHLEAQDAKRAGGTTEQLNDKGLREEEKKRRKKGRRLRGTRRRR
jgi:hypothetical protein